MKESDIIGFYEEEQGEEEADKDKHLYTKKFSLGEEFFEEVEHRRAGREVFRKISAERSKLGAAIKRGLDATHIKRGSSVLYLGAGHGYTPSFVSDVVGEEGSVFCLDSSPEVVKSLVFMCESRSNATPLLADARDPSSYEWRVPTVEIVYQDVAQQNQVEIFLDNCEVFLKKGGFGLLAVKAKSIDVSSNPKKIFKKIRKRFSEKKDYVITDYRELAPFQQDHAFFVVKKKKS